MSIKVLSARLANQIAAGEVVERPASVVKELVENSLDAGATTIDIVLDKGGQKRLHIRDDGSGIVKDELALALDRHATSKISSVEDLAQISSLGFRGEALASISSVSRLTLTSKPAAQQNAWQAQASGRDMDVTVNPASHPNGTTIEVLDLFFNTPARRRFLRTEKTEFTHIDELIKRIAISRFDVQFTLTHNNKQIRQYKRAITPAQQDKRVAQICGRQFGEQALRFDAQCTGLRLWGWLVPPQACAKQTDKQFCYVNGRMIRDKLINHAIRQSYGDLLPEGLQPTYVLFLEIGADEVDVNVHPTKHEVRFHQGRWVHDFVINTLKKSLAEVMALTGETDEPESRSSAIFASPLQANHEAMGASRSSSSSPSREQHPEHRGHNTAQYLPRDHTPRESAYQPPSSWPSTPSVSLPPLSPQPRTTDVVMGENVLWRVLSVYQGRYALLEYAQGYYLSDLQPWQPSLVLRTGETTLASKPLLLPKRLAMCEAFSVDIALKIDSLNGAGFSLAFMGETVMIRAIPVALALDKLDGLLTAYLSREDLQDVEAVPVVLTWLNSPINVPVTLEQAQALLETRITRDDVPGWLNDYAKPIALTTLLTPSS
jgi:DNA mismatch repair protein MutL